MKFRWLAIAAVAVVAVGIAAAVFQVRLNVSPFVGTCYRDDQVDPADRKAVEAAARGFVGDAASQSPRRAYDAMSIAGKASITGTGFESAVKSFQSDMLTAPGQVTGVYVVNSQWPSSIYQMAPCDLSNPAGVDFSGWGPQEGRPTSSWITRLRMVSAHLKSGSYMKVAPGG